MSNYISEKPQSMIPVKYVFGSYVKAFDAPTASVSGAKTDGESEEKVSEGKIEVKSTVNGQSSAVSDDFAKRLTKAFAKAFPSA